MNYTECLRVHGGYIETHLIYFQMRLVIRQLVGFVGYLPNQEVIMRLWGYEVNIEIIYKRQLGTN